MITKELPPFCDLAKVGRTDHGILFTRRVDGAIERRLLMGGIEHPVSATVGVTPTGRRMSSTVKHPAAPPLGMSPAVLAAERVAGRAWVDYATLAGDNGVFYGVAIGARAWVAILPDGRAWKVEIVNFFSDHWRMEFSRGIGGPINPAGPPARVFSIRLTNNSGGKTEHFTSSIFSLDGGPNAPTYYTIADISLYGRRAMVRATKTAGDAAGGLFNQGAGNVITIRIPSAAEFSAWGINLETATGHYAGALFDAVENNTMSGTQTPVYNHVAMWARSYIMDWTDQRVMATFRAGVLSGAEYINNYPGVGGSMSVTTETVSNGQDRRLFVHTPPDKPIVYFFEVERRAHISDKPDESDIIYKSRVEATVRVRANGPFVSYESGYPGEIPDSATEAYYDWEINQTVTYGDNAWSATSEHREVYDASTIAFGVGAGPSFTEPTWSLQPPVNAGNLKPFILFFQGPENNSSGDDWGLSGYDYSTQQQSIPNQVASEFCSQLMHKISLEGSEFSEWFPAHSVIPSGTYFKGQFVSDFLPRHNLTWAYNPQENIIASRPRPAVESDDGYLSAVYI